MTSSPFRRDLFTGFVSLLTIAGLVWMLWRFGELRGLSEKTYQFDIKLTSAEGLSSTASISFSGVKVGKVVAIKNEPDPRNGVVVRAQVKEEISIPRSVQIIIDKGFVGDSSLDLRLPADASAESITQTLKKDGTDALGPTKALSLFADLANVAQNASKELTDTAKEIRRVAVTLETTGQRLNDLLEPRTVAEVDSGEKQPNLRSTMARADAALASANKWLGDDVALSDAKASLARIKTLIDDASSAVKNIDDTSKEVKAIVSANSPRIQTLIDDANKTIHSVDTAANSLSSIAASIEKGEGTLGQLVKNPDLYRNLDEAARRLDAALVEAKLMIEKFKQEGLPLKLR